MPLLTTALPVGELRKRVARGEAVDICGARGKTQALYDIADASGDAVVLHVPRQLDRSAYVVLELAASRGLETAKEVGAALASSPADPRPALKRLEELLGETRILVDDLDRLTTSSWDLPGALRPLDEELRKWLDRIAVVRTHSRDVDGCERTGELQPLQDPRWKHDLLWNRVDQDADRYLLAVSRELLFGASEAGTWSLEGLVSDLRDGMSRELEDLLSLLSVHDRPLRNETLVALGVPARILTAAVQAMLVENARDTIWLPTVWRREWSLSEQQRRTWHERLAERFAGMAEEEGPALAQPLAILEAHRHFAAIPNLARAREFARYGAALLLDAGKRTSLTKRFRAAADIYTEVIALDAQMREIHADQERAGVGPLARAYAIHYRHYNRYRAGMEEPVDTLAGYREALTQWKENALFWSRTIRCCFVADRYDEALRARADALQFVPPHLQKDAYIVGRTTEKLLDRELVLPAVLVWGDHLSGSGAVRAVHDKLRERLLRSWRTDRLWAGYDEWVRFRSPEEMRMTTSGKAWTLHGLEREYEGRSPAAAVAAAARAVRAELASVGEGELDDRRKKLVEIVDLDAAAATGDELLRWAAYLLSLDGRVGRGEITTAQRDALRDVWRRARKTTSGLRRPAAGRTDDGGCYLTWSYEDLPALSMTIEVDRDGRFAWFFRDTSDGRAEGTSDEHEETLPAQVFDLLRPFSR